MRANLSAGEMEEVSELIGAIYDCAIEPERWDGTLDAIRKLLNCANGTFYLFDTETEQHRLYRVVGVEPHWQRLMEEYAPHLAEVFQHVGDAATRPIDQIFVMQRELSPEFLQSSFYYRNWAVPQGIEDLIQVTLLRERSRLSMLAMGRYGRDGPVGDREVHLLSLLAPHLRRAVAITDLIDVQTLQAENLGATLDAIAIGVLLVDADGRVLHANVAARSMLQHGDPIGMSGGRLSAVDAAATSRLLAAVADAAAAEAGIGDSGLGVPLASALTSLHVAHVLPVSRGDVRSRLMPRAVAAIFVSSADGAPPMKLGPVAEAFGLTPAEARLLDRLVRGETLEEAAAALNVAKTTSRTHMARILTKTGTRRQANLLALVHRLVPSLRPGTD